MRTAWLLPAGLNQGFSEPGAPGESRTFRRQARKWRTTIPRPRRRQVLRAPVGRRAGTPGPKWAPSTTRKLSCLQRTPSKTRRPSTPPSRRASTFPSGIPSRFTAFFEIVSINRLQCGQRFFWHFPLAQNLVDGARGEAGGDQAAHYAGGLFGIFGFADALAFEMLAGQSLLVGLAVAGFEGFGDQFRTNALLFQILADAALTQFLVLLAK